MLATMKITLINEQKQELKIQHSKTCDGRVHNRIKAVIHASNGWSPEEITDALLIHESTVRQHIKDYLQSNKLKSGNGGSQSYLSAQKPKNWFSI
uniref:helix-turn-helix domain-containing protein n=1 Tax=Vibrio anguillarum TaxID=55601 RepID=UPI001E28A97F|nr:helix-turn-helix domain-containing protein [Vibrio anguillarum]